MLWRETPLLDFCECDGRLGLNSSRGHVTVTGYAVPTCWCWGTFWPGTTVATGSVEGNSSGFQGRKRVRDENHRVPAQDAVSGLRGQCTSRPIKVWQPRNGWRPSPLPRHNMEPARVMLDLPLLNPCCSLLSTFPNLQVMRYLRGEVRGESRPDDSEREILVLVSCRIVSMRHRLSRTANAAQICSVRRRVRP